MFDSFFVVVVGKELSASYFTEPTAGFVTGIALFFKMYILLSLVLWRIVK